MSMWELNSHGIALRIMDYGQLVPKTTRTQDNSYPRQLVPRTTRTQLSWGRVVLGTSCLGYELSGSPHNGYHITNQLFSTKVYNSSLFLRSKDHWQHPLRTIPGELNHMIWAFFPLNTLRPRQNGRHIADDMSKCILMNENVWITIKNSLKFVPKGPINNIPALVQIWTNVG